MGSGCGAGAGATVSGRAEKTGDACGQRPLPVRDGPGKTGKAVKIRQGAGGVGMGKHQGGAAVHGGQQGRGHETPGLPRKDRPCGPRGPMPPKSGGWPRRPPRSGRRSVFGQQTIFQEIPARERFFPSADSGRVSAGPAGGRLSMDVIQSRSWLNGIYRLQQRLLPYMRGRRVSRHPPVSPSQAP